MAAKKPAPKVEGPKGWINRAYLYGERHVATVALVNLGIGIVLTVVALYGFHHEGEIETRVTREVARVESKCQRYGPHSPQCHESFGAALKSLNETLTPVEARIIVCRSHLFDQLDACKKVRRIEAAESEPEKASGPTASATAPNGEVMPSTPSTGHSPPGPSSGGPTDTPSHPHGPSVPHQSPHGHESGGGEVPAASPAPAPSSGPSQPPSSTVERSTETVVVQPPAPTPAPEAEPPARTAVGGLTESVGATVEGLGETAGGTVEGVEATACTLAKVLCP